MSQFQRAASKTGIATFVPLPATPGTVVVPVSDPLSLLRMVVIDLNADPGASNQMVTLKTGGVLVGAEFFLMLRSSVAVAGAPFVIVQDESLGVIYGFSLAGVTADSYRWVKVRWNGGADWEVVSYYISGAPHTTLSGDGLTLGERSVTKGSLELLSDAHAHSAVLEPNGTASGDTDVFMPPDSGVLATQQYVTALAASTTAAGLVELATDAETVAGSSSVLATTPAGLKARLCMLAASAQTVSNTTLAAITSLTTGTLPAGTYGFELVLDVTQTSTGGYKLDFAGGTAAFSSFLANTRITDVNSGLNTLVLARRSTAANTAQSVGTAATPVFGMINGSFVVSTAGTFAPRMALNTAVGAMSVTALSTLKVFRVS